MKKTHTLLGFVLKFVRLMSVLILVSHVFAQTETTQSGLEVGRRGRTLA